MRSRKMKAALAAEAEQRYISQRETIWKPSNVTLPSESAVQRVNTRAARHILRYHVQVMVRL